MTPPKADSTPREPATSSIAATADESLENRARKALVDWLTKEHPAPGQPVPVREFARRLGMSRTPVRSAVGRLYERGLLAYDPVAGFTVAIPSLSSIYELFELRLMLESHALRLFGERTDRQPCGPAARTRGRGRRTGPGVGGGPHPLHRLPGERRPVPPRHGGTGGLPGCWSSTTTCISASM